MKWIRSFPLFLLLTYLLLSGCNTTLGLKKQQDNLRIPSWFINPVNKEVIGFIGAAAKYDSQGKINIAGSRKAALALLLTHHQLAFSGFDHAQLQSSAKLVLSQTHTVRFLPEFNHQGVIYSYATLEQNPFSLSQQQTLAHLSRCQFTQCSPSWLCDEKSNTITGVSFFTSSPSQQLSKAQQNANLIANLLYQSQVNATEYLSQSGHEKLAIQSASFSQSSQVSAKTTRTNQLLLKNVCEYNSTLIGNFVLPEPTIKLARDWQSQSMYQDRSLIQGRFGYGGQMSPDLLLSSAIELAIKDALIELAKIKGIEIEQASSLTFNNGYYFISHSKMTVDEQVSGQLLDIKLSYQQDRPIVNVWLLETKHPL